MTIFIFKSLTSLDEDVLVIIYIYIYISKMNFTGRGWRNTECILVVLFVQLKQILIGTFDYNSQSTGDILVSAEKSTDIDNDIIIHDI